jgi:membrane-associated phospholipid phosphatase
MEASSVLHRPWWARIISTVLHPLVMPMLTLVLLFAFDPYLRTMPGVFVYLLLVVVVNTAAPAISLFVLYRKGFLSDLEIAKRSERTLPFLIVLAYFVLTYVLLVTGETLYIPAVYLSTWVGLIASIALALLITKRFKISMHMLGQGGLLGTVMAVQNVHFESNFELNAILVLLAGAVGWARIRLGVHRHVEVYSGYLLGFTVCFITVLMGWGGAAW